MSLKFNFYKTSNLEARLRFAENALKEFDIYKLKNIVAGAEDIKQTLDAFYATFQLMVTQSKIALKKTTIQEVDLQLIKDQLIVVFKCASHVHFFQYIRCMTQGLLLDFLHLNYLKTGRIFLNLCNYVVGYDQTIDDLNKHKYILWAEQIFKNLFISFVFFTATVLFLQQHA